MLGDDMAAGRGWRPRRALRCVWRARGQFAPRGRGSRAGSPIDAHCPPRAPADARRLAHQIAPASRHPITLTPTPITPGSAHVVALQTNIRRGEPALPPSPAERSGFATLFFFFFFLPGLGFFPPLCEFGRAREARARAAFSPSPSATFHLSVGAAGVRFDGPSRGGARAPAAAKRRPAAKPARSVSWVGWGEGGRGARGRERRGWRHTARAGGGLRAGRAWGSRPGDRSPRHGRCGAPGGRGRHARRRAG